LKASRCHRVAESGEEESTSEREIVESEPSLSLTGPCIAGLGIAQPTRLNVGGLNCAQGFLVDFPSIVPQPQPPSIFRGKDNAHHCVLLDTFGRQIQGLKTDRKIANRAREKSFQSIYPAVQHLKWQSAHEKTSSLRLQSPKALENLRLVLDQASTQAQYQRPRRHLKLFTSTRKAVKLLLSLRCDVLSQATVRPSPLPRSKNMMYTMRRHTSTVVSSAERISPPSIS